MIFQCIVIVAGLSIKFKLFNIITTVKELKEQLETLPDNADVYWYKGGDINEDCPHFQAKVSQSIEEFIF